MKNQLVIVGGPSGVGKSTFMKKMRRGEYQQLCEQIGSPMLSSAPFAKIGKLSRETQSLGDKFVPHYDFLHHYSADVVGEFEYISDVLGKFSDVTVVTLCCSADVLEKRNSARLFKAYLSAARSLFLKKSKRDDIAILKTRQEFYRNQSNVIGLYQKWSSLLAEHGVKQHFFIDLMSTEGEGAAELYEQVVVEEILVA